jgi:hypothetical protein
MRGILIVSIALVGWTGLAVAQELPSAPPPIEGQAPPEVQPLPPAASPAERPTFEQFYQTLAPYGWWMRTPEYGPVWVPSEASNPTWRPYTRGRWVSTDSGWTFVSDEPWGWAPYHYGRWIYYPGLGCSWIPGYEWSPAWVSWRYGDDYLAWAPLGPAYLPISYYDAPSLWSAVPIVYFTLPLERRYFLPTAYVPAVFRRTYFVGVPTGRVYRSPPAWYVQRRVGHPIQRVPANVVAPRSLPLGAVYRPRVLLDRASRMGRPVPAMPPPQVRPPPPYRGPGVQPTPPPNIRGLPPAPRSAPNLRGNPPPPTRAPGPSRTHEAPPRGRLGGPSSPENRPARPPPPRHENRR